jgi:acetyl-CoA synthetase
VPDADVPLRRHGDHMARLPNGYYRALGRVDDTMNLGGVKVSSAEIERAVEGVDGVTETAAIAVAPEGGGPSRLVIYAVPAISGEADLQRWQAEMQAAIRSRLNPLFKVDEVVAIDELPRTASAKVMRRVLRESSR